MEMDHLIILIAWTLAELRIGNFITMYAQNTVLILYFILKDKCYFLNFSGEKVMGILPSGAASSRVKVRPELLWPVPVHWNLEDAVTVPSAYLQAFYCYVSTLTISRTLHTSFYIFIVTQT